jgi:hypothetical protein
MLPGSGAVCSCVCQRTDRLCGLDHAACIKQLSAAEIYQEQPVMKHMHRIYIIFAAFALATTLGCASTAERQGTGEYVDDAVITTKTKAAIFNEPTLKSAEINVETFRGVVQLSGFVGSQAEINRAVEVTRSVGGVTSVRNDMRLR